MYLVGGRWDCSVAAAKVTVKSLLSNPLEAAICLLHGMSIHCRQPDDHLLTSAEQADVGGDGSLQQLWHQLQYRAASMLKYAESDMCSCEAYLKLALNLLLKLHCGWWCAGQHRPLQQSGER